MILLVAAGYNILNAYHDAQRIEAGKRIFHGLNGLLYLALCTGLYFAYRPEWSGVVCVILLRKLVFDLALNTFRGLPLFYFSRKTGSIIDKWTLRIVGNNMILLYSLITAAIIILNLLK